MKKSLATALLLFVVITTDPLQAAQPSGTAPQADNQIRIRVYDYAGVSEDVLQKAEDVTTSIFQKAGLDFVWFTCARNGKFSDKASCPDAMDPTDLILNLVPHSMSKGLRVKDEVEGLAVDGPDRFSGHAWVFFDRAKEVAAKHLLNLANVLGSLMAHELGHLLLGSSSHSKIGLMRAGWSREEFIAANRGELGFSASERERIQKGVEARYRASR
jgi:hypothetical protein